MNNKEKLKRKRLYIKKLFRRNSKILNSTQRKIKRDTVNLHWWSTERSDNIENVGDYLSTIVCNFMLNQKRINFNNRVDKTAHLYSIGSIIQGGAQNSVIWGSGLKHGDDDIDWLMKKTRKLDIRLVRGPKTRKSLLSNGYYCPEKYGDPALIMPLIYEPQVKEKKDYLVILHHETKHIIPNSITPLTDDYKDFIDKIYNSKIVISSSLHGIILAEAYGVPAILLKDKATESIFKYDDYYHSTGRYDYPIVNSVQEALEITPPTLPDFKDMINNIIDSFPYDLWNK